MDGNGSKQTMQIKCTYPDCHEYFAKRKHMKNHKESSSVHEYCRKCDFDAEDCDDLHKHKVEATNEKGLFVHAYCHLCTLEYNSWDGLSLHMERKHPPDQKIDCPKCCTRFAQAAAYMRHIEVHVCSKIRPDIGFTREQLYSAVREEERYNDMVKHPENYVTAMPSTDDAASEAEEGVVSRDEVSWSPSSGAAVVDTKADLKNECPICFRGFGSVEAVVAHTERTLKCRIRASERYPEYMFSLTGGFLGARTLPRPEFRPREADAATGGRSMLPLETQFEASTLDEDDERCE